jgi:peptidoglycan/LPS O-acetylase OafA/YrhL
MSSEPPPDPHSEYLAARYFPSLDGLRAISILIVVAFHTRMLWWGFYGVQLFFAISGLLITTLLLREQAATGVVSLRNFYVRRVLRIFPLYYAVLAVYVVLVLVFEHGSVPGRQFMGNLKFFATYTSNWFVDTYSGNRIIFYFAWSLATEEQFYMFWPGVVRFARRRWLVPVGVMTAMLLIGQAGRWAVANGALSEDTVPGRMLMHIAGPICLGSMAAYALHSRSGFQRAYAVLGRAWSAPAAAVLALACMVIPGTPNIVYSTAFTLLVIACVVRPDHLLRPVLEQRFLVYIGSISYGMYLLHMIAINTIHRFTPSNALTLTLALPLTVLMAGLSYRYFERPFLSLKARFTAPAASTLRPRAA